ncbi:MAG: HEAT repeat domain-containing protein [candidate division NC10 bacterium]|nr:HEAT repeat domain-containing protein [candidate division NC10 bacterium]
MVRDESRDRQADAGFSRELAEILVGIKKATRVFLAYPGKHPARAQALERTHKQIAQLLSQQAPLSLQIKSGGFSCADAPVGRNHPLLQGFALEFTRRGIQAIRFLPGVHLEDLQHITDLLIADAATLSRQGGGRAFLQGRGASTVEVEDLDVKFETVSARGEPAIGGERGSEPVQQAAPPAPAAVAVQPAPTEVASPQAAQMPTGGAGGESATPTGSPEEARGGEAEGRAKAEDEVPPDLEALIIELQKTDRPARYEYLTEELSRRGREALTQGEGNICLRIMAALAMELHQSSPKEEKITRYARWTLRSLLDESGPQLLVDGFCRRGLLPEHQLVHLLLTVKEETASAVVDRLLIEREMGARQRLADMLIQMGPAALPAVQSALTAPSWETARRLFPLLPRLAMPELAENLKRFFRHSDPRIRRESIRLYGQLGAEQGGDPLLALLGDTDTSVRLAAIAALGGLKVKAAVPPLRQLAEAHPGTRDLEEQKRAIAALGAIGDPQVLPTLIGLLHRRRWLSRRRTEDLRIAAAYALGALRMPEGMEALRAAARSGPAALKRACEVALRGAHSAEKETEGTQ